MYVPVGQRGQSRQPGAAQSQVVAQQSNSLANSIFQADSSLQAKKKEAQRQYENAQTMMRSDLNAVAEFDVTKAGSDKAAQLTLMAKDISEQIREANNPVEARALIASFRDTYNKGVAREAVKSEAMEQASGMIGADRATLDSLNSGLAAGMEYDEVDASWLANADQKWNKEYVYQDGKMYVRGPEGDLVPEDEAEFLQDTSMYNVGTHSVDVGSLGDWAQSNATKTAIGFKNGTWDETRARGIYRDNVLLEEREGKTHRLQLLTTMEDRGLTSHLSEKEKADFRDGVNLTSEKFKEIIEAGEDEFVERSQFEGIIGGKGKNTSGRGGSNAEDDNITVKGLNVPSQAGEGGSATANLLSDLEITGQAQHSINRFNKMPSLTGTFEIPGKPNTDKVDIVGAGINSKGQRVAYIRGYENVVTETGIPGFEDSDKKKFFKEIVIGSEELGASADVYQEIYQNHPKMAELIENQLDEYEENKKRRPRRVEGEGAEGGPSLAEVDGQTTAADLVESGKQAVEKYTSNQEALNLVTGDRQVPDYMLADLFEETMGMSYEDMLEREKSGSSMPLMTGIRQAFFDQGFSLSGNSSSTMRALMKEKLGADNAALREQYPEVQNEIKNEGRAAYAKSQDQLQKDRQAKEEARELEESRPEREEAAKSQFREETRDFFLDNPIGRFFGYKDKDQRAEEAERIERRDNPRSKPINISPEKTADLVSNLPKSKRDAFQRRVDVFQNENGRQTPIRVEKDGNKLVFTDERGRPLDIPPMALGFESSPMASIATTAIFNEEGYTASGTLVNVPKSKNSGVTIGGLDLGSKAGDIDRKLEILGDYIPEEQIRELRKISNLVGTEASNALASAQDAGKIDASKWGFTDDTFKEMQSRYLDERTIPAVVKKITKFAPEITQEDIQSLPEPVIQAITSMEFVTPGEGRESSSLTAVAKAMESGDPADWLLAAKTYDVYYGGAARQADSLKTGRILDGNVKRAKRAAELIRSVYS